MDTLTGFHMMENYSTNLVTSTAHWMTLKDAMLSERSQSRKIAYRSRVIFHSGVLKATKLQWWADQWLLGAPEGRESTTLKIQQGSIWGNGVFCVLTVAGATQIYTRVKIHRSVHRAKVNFAIYYLKDKFWTIWRNQTSKQWKGTGWQTLSKRSQSGYIHGKQTKL